MGKPPLRAAFLFARCFDNRPRALAMSADLEDLWRQVLHDLTPPCQHDTPIDECPMDGVTARNSER
jgi:hypothetical protein